MKAVLIIGKITLLLMVIKVNAACCLPPYGHCTHELKIRKEGYSFIQKPTSLNEEEKAASMHKDSTDRFVCSDCNHYITAHLCDKDGIPQEGNIEARKALE